MASAALTNAVNNKVGGDAFLALRLAPGWQLNRRAYNGQGLSHIYFSTKALAAQANSNPPLITPKGVVPIRVIPYRPMR